MPSLGSRFARHQMPSRRTAKYPVTVGSLVLGVLFSPVTGSVTVRTSRVMTNPNVSVMATHFDSLTPAGRAAAFGASAAEAVSVVIQQTRAARCRYFIVYLRFLVRRVRPRELPRLRV
jgi:hypothetical protein